MGLKYTAAVGINYPGKDGKSIRVEAGEAVPASVVKRSPWLLEQGLVTEAGEEVREIVESEREGL